MNLWKITDMYSRDFYYEDMKVVKRRFKQLTWEWERDRKFYGSGWLKYPAPSVKQAISDNWVDVEVISKKDMEEYIFKRNDKDIKWRKKQEEDYAKFKAAHPVYHQQPLDNSIVAAILGTQPTEAT